MRNKLKYILFFLMLFFFILMSAVFFPGRGTEKIELKGDIYNEIIFIFLVSFIFTIILFVYDKIKGNK